MGHRNGAKTLFTRLQKQDIASDPFLVSKHCFGLFFVLPLMNRVTGPGTALWAKGLMHRISADHEALQALCYVHRPPQPTAT